MYSWISYANGNQCIKPGDKVTVQGPCNNPSLDRVAERVNVIAENGLQVNMLALTSLSKDKPSKVRPAYIARPHELQGGALGDYVSMIRFD